MPLPPEAKLEKAVPADMALFIVVVSIVGMLVSIRPSKYHWAIFIKNSL